MSVEGSPISGGSTVRNPIFARLYVRLSAAMELGGMAEHRAALLEGLGGRVIEVGAGNGLSFGHYPAAVEEVVAVEPEPYLREQARAAAPDAPVPVRVVDGLAGRLPAADGTADAVVCSLVLCSVPDQRVALSDIRRVLRPGGELRFFEHVRARQNGLTRVQRVIDLAWPKVAGGCHTSRDTVGAIEQAGFAITRIDRFRFPDTRFPLPTAPHVLGRATAPHEGHVAA